MASGAAEATRFVLHLQPLNEMADATAAVATPLVSVFPTVLRAGDVVNVQAETGADARAELLDGFGQPVAVRTLAGTNAHAELPTAGLRRGVYTVRLTTASRTSVQRIVIE